MDEIFLALGMILTAKRLDITLEVFGVFCTMIHVFISYQYMVVAVGAQAMIVCCVVR